MFRLDARQFFLTYTHCDADAQQLFDFINGIAKVDFCRVALEHHQDGQPHRHVVFKFSNRFQTRNQRIFDYEGCHPNIQVCRKLGDALKYCEKEEHVDYGDVPSATKDYKWSDIVAAAGSDEMSWLQVVHEARVQPHVAGALRRMMNSRIYDLDAYDDRPIDPILEIMADPNFKSLLIVGAPGIGKTGWAMKYAPRPALLCRHVDTLRYFRADYHKSIVFDDINFSHLPRNTQLQIAGFEDQAQIHCRYNVAVLPSRVPRLFLCNYNHEPFMSDPAIQEIDANTGKPRRLTILRL